MALDLIRFVTLEILLVLIPEYLVFRVGRHIYELEYHGSNVLGSECLRSREEGRKAGSVAQLVEQNTEDV